MAQFPFFSSWLQSLSSRLSIALPASVTQSSLLKYYNCVSSPSCSSAGTRPKVINLSELISSACTLSLSPDVSISHSPVHSRAGNWHAGGWEQWHNRNKSFCAVLFLTLTQKKYPFLSQPHHPHFALQHFLTSHRKNWACSIWWLQNSLIQKLLQFVMPICRNVIDSHIHTYCVSLLKMPEKKEFKTTSFFFNTGITCSTGYSHNDQVIKQPQFLKGKPPFPGQTLTLAGTRTDKQAEIPSSFSQGPVWGLTN